MAGADESQPFLSSEDNCEVLRGRGNDTEALTEFGFESLEERRPTAFRECEKAHKPVEPPACVPCCILCKGAHVTGSRSCGLRFERNGPSSPPATSEHQPPTPVPPTAPILNTSRPSRPRRHSVSRGATSASRHRSVSFPPLPRSEASTALATTTTSPRLTKKAVHEALDTSEEYECFVRGAAVTSSPLPQPVLSSTPPARDLHPVRTPIACHEKVDMLELVGMVEGKLKLSERKNLVGYGQQMKPELLYWVTDEAMPWDEVEAQNSLGNRTPSPGSFHSHLELSGTGLATPPPLLYSVKKPLPAHTRGTAANESHEEESQPALKGSEKESPTGFLRRSLHMVATAARRRDSDDVVKNDV
ncbi:uncharacterized protein [Dermacentor albipictus]|uniref:uncharacterized protein n=1 Tax=Dermacentor albipictus TaxID=60249 RepID=UPI0031FC440E